MDSPSSMGSLMDKENANKIENVSITYHTPGVFGTRIITMNPSCQLFQFSISFVLLGITCIFGFIGNILSILTLRRDVIKSVTTFLLSALAVADVAFLVPAVFVIMIPTYCEFYQHCTGGFLRAIPYLEQFGWTITSTCHMCTVYVTVLVALHRYICVCRLQLAEKFSGFRRVKIQVALVPVLSLLYNTPRFFEYKIIHYAWNDTSSTDERMIRRETTKILATVGKNYIFQIGYKNVLFFIVMYLVPLSILIMVSVNLIKALKRRRISLQRIGSANSTASQCRNDDTITLVLIVIIASFIVCQTPIVIQRLILPKISESKYNGCGQFYFYFEHIADYMILLNSSTNFVIYILFSPHFRQTLVSAVLPKCPKMRLSICITLTNRRASDSEYIEVQEHQIEGISTNKLAYSTLPKSAKELHINDEHPEEKCLLRHINDVSLGSFKFNSQTQQEILNMHDEDDQLEQLRTTNVDEPNTENNYIEDPSPLNNEQDMNIPLIADEPVSSTKESK